MKLEYIVGGFLCIVILSGVYVFVQSDTEATFMMKKDGVGVMATSSERMMPSKDLIKALQMKERTYPKAPEITHADGFLNTDGRPITISEFKGKKVILIDFWTYSCINCQRTLPYVNAWYEKYKNDGLVVIGIHTPEFSFEKSKDNVAEALTRLGVKHPVVLDNEYGTWNAFGNQYWPRKYLIDIDGYVVYDHAGEGNYDETESAIQKALSERSEHLNASSTVPTDMAHPKSVMEVSSSLVGSPETYFGSARNEFLSNGRSGMSGEQTMMLPSTFTVNKLYLGGKWNVTSEYAEGSEGSDIVYKFSSKSVYFVASSKAGADIEISLDGKLVGTEADADVKAGMLHVQEDRLYKIIEANGYGVHTLRMHIKKGTLDAFTFTFG